MEGFKSKTTEELESQVTGVSEALGTEISLNQIDSSVSFEEIQAKYPERYKSYLKILRAKKNRQEVDASELEIYKMKYAR